MSDEATISWTVCAFDGLDARLLHDLLRLRIDVFVVEQNCPYPEVDGLDLEALHVIGRDPHGRPVAYCRIIPPHEDGLPHIGRVVVDKSRRGERLGKQLIAEALRAVERTYGRRQCALAAQRHLQVFYEAFGFRAIGEAYLLDGIPHVDMTLSAGSPD